MIGGFPVLARLLGTVGLGRVCSTSLGQGKLLLKSGFEEGVRVTDDMERLTGSDVQSGFQWYFTSIYREAASVIQPYRSARAETAGPSRGGGSSRS